MADAKPRRPLTYADSGVDIEAGDEMVGLIERHMRRTYGPRVMGKHGAFAGLFRLDYNEKLFRRNYRDPVLVACTDGVGSKVKLAVELGVYDTVGIDCVAMNVNDMLVQGAEPLLFLDYIGTHKLDPARMADIVKGVADGCELADCALLGGETAELPDLYAAGDFDLAGFSVGVVELRRAIDPARVEPGDVILGLASSGVHSNGFSLVRAIIREAGLDLNQSYPELHEGGEGSEGSEGDEGVKTLGRVLLEPTRIYVRSVVRLLRSYRVKQVVSGMAHITGGGLVGNVPRVLGANVDAKIDAEAWPRPAIFRFLQERGHVDEAEMWRVFNMGIGYVLIVRPHFAQAVAARLTRSGETVHTLGRIVKGRGRVKMTG